MSKSKELHFFDNEEIDWSNPDYDSYHNCFDHLQPNQVHGEATPIYAYWPSCAERIYKYNRNVKFIINLRNPIYRATSQWAKDYSRGAETRDFGSAIREELSQPDHLIEYLAT